MRIKPDVRYSQDGAAVPHESLGNGSGAGGGVNVNLLIAESCIV